MHRLRKFEYLLLLAVAAGYLYWSWSTILGGFGGDNANYLLMAQYYSPFSAASAPALHVGSTSIYPPLFPILLGLFDGGHSLLVAHLVTTGCLIIAFMLFYRWLKIEKIDTHIRLWSLIALALLPGIYFQTLSIHSENLYLVLTTAALLSLSIAQHHKSQRQILFTIFFISAAYLTRTAGIALILAALTWLWLHRAPQRVWFSLLLISPVLIWSQIGNTSSTNYWQYLLNGYHNPAGIADQIVVQSRYLFEGWKVNFGDSRASTVAGIATLAIGLTGAAWRTRLGYADGIYVFCYLLMATIWPFPAEAQRLTVAIMPVILAQSVWVAYRWQLATTKIRPLLVVLLATILIAVVPEFLLHLHRFQTPMPEGVPASYSRAEWWYATDIKAAEESIRSMAALETGMRNLKDKVPENECIVAIKPSVVAYLSERESIPPLSNAADAATFEHAAITGECRYFYMIIYTSPSYSAPLYPYERLKHMLEIIEPTYLAPGSNDDSIVGLLARIK
jgi:hypothetical protein